MDQTRRGLVLAGLAMPAFGLVPQFALAEGGGRAAPETILLTWYKLIFELVRHTPTYSPPVASRAFAYGGITAYEALAGGPGPMTSLSGQLTGLTDVPQREAGAEYDEAAILQSAMTEAVRNFFSNTGPSGQGAIAAMTKSLDKKATAGLSPEVAARSAAYGKAVADHILAWSANDGGAVIENMGFPLNYTPSPEPGHWVPTSTIAQQQAPLLPEWGNNRPFAMPKNVTCSLSAPMAFSEKPDSAFYKQAMEVYDTCRHLTDEQTAIARFWADDAMLSTTPPGHWNQIACSILTDENASAQRCAAVLARLGIVVADAFIACWQSKYEFNTIRPVTYIKRVIDKTWEPLLITPPFPEFPSGHSTQSGAAAVVLTAIWGDNFAYTDNSHGDDGLPARSYPSFWAAANEAGISRLYGGIHFREAIEHGLEQGRCVGAYSAALKMGPRA